VLTWTPDDTQAGTYPTVTLTATDGHGGSASAAFTITVTNTNRPPVVAAIRDTTISENQPLTLTPSGSDPDGDALTWSGANLPAGASVNATTGVLTWTPSYTQAGVYGGVTLTAQDAQGASTSVSFTLTVLDANRPPTVASIHDTTVVGDDVTTLMLTPSGSDPDGDVLTWSGTNLPAGATVNASTGVFTWTPSHTQGGSYPGITLTASDGRGGSAATSFTVTVQVPTAIALIAKLPAPTRLAIPTLAPNPFAGRVECVVGTPTAARIVVTIWDANGRRITTLAPQQVTAGYTSFVWDGRDERGANVPGGVYFVRADAGREHAMRRIVKLN
jgi:hypothetical protein